MSTKGILKAGNKIQTNLTGASNYDLKVGGVSVSSVTSSITLGPYEDDQFYELTVNSGVVSVSCYDALINGVTSSVALADLGSAQSAGAEQIVTDAGSNVVKSIRGKYVPVDSTYNNSLAVIGDSFTSNAYFKSATAEEWNGKGYLTHAMMLSGYRLKLVAMCAVAGSGVSADINGVKFDTQLTNAIASGAKNLLVMGGINDSNQNISPDVTVAAYKALINRAVLAGMRVFVCTQPTQDSQFTATYTVARQGAQLQVQDTIRQYCQRINPDNVILIDCAQACTDPASSTASYRANYTSDYLHPNNVGAYAIGKKIAEVWNKYIPECGSLICSNADNVAYSPLSKNQLSNGLMISSSGGAATGFTFSAGGSAVIGTKAISARADGVGNNQDVPFTFSAAGDFVRITSPTVTTFNDGDTLYAEMEITISSPVNVRGVRASFQINGNVTTRSCTVNQKDDTLDRAITEGVTYVIRTPEIKYEASIQGATHNALLNITCSAQGAGSGVLSVGRMAIKKVA